MSVPTRQRAAWIGAALLAVLAGCEGGGVLGVGGHPNRPPPPPPPQSPAAVVRGVEWSFDFRSPDVYRGLLTDDFRLGVASTDTAGTAFRALWTRDDELDWFANLVDPRRWPLREIDLDFDPTLAVHPDPRPGHGSVHFRTIRTGYHLRITDGARQTVDSRGVLQFFVVRGDSAAVPDGGPPDSTRWYVSRIEDETGDSTGWASLRTLLR